MKSFNMAYGDGSIPLSLRYGEFLGRLECARVRGIENEEQSIIDALNRPIGKQPLFELAKRAKKVTIIVSDITRVTKSETLMKVIIPYLERNGINRDDITIVFSTGTHRKMTNEEKTKLLGDEYYRTIQTMENECDNRDIQVYLGTTSRGTPVYIHREIVRADLVIVTGAIVFHNFAGFGGGRKGIVPGVASRDTIFSNHKLMIDREGGKIHATVDTGVLQGNPIHEDMVEATKLINHTFLVNVVLNADHQIAGVFAGDLYDAHARGVEMVKQIYGSLIQVKSDVVFVSCGGYPKDINFYQGFKSLSNAVRAVRENGTVVLFGQFRDGLGAPGFDYWFNEEVQAKLIEEMYNRFEVVGQIAYWMREWRKKYRIIGYTDLPVEQAEMIFIEPVENIRTLESAIVERYGENYRYYIIPNGSLTVPIMDKNVN